MEDSFVQLQFLVDAKYVRKEKVNEFLNAYQLKDPKLCRFDHEGWPSHDAMKSEPYLEHIMKSRISSA